MEDIKLAFETIIVGLLAIPWLLVFSHIILYLLTRTHLLSKLRAFIADGQQSFALLGTLVIGLAYCIGTVIFPLADDYFNDPHRFPIYVRDDDAIRIDTLAKIYFDPDHKYYDLCEDDFPGLPNASKSIKTIKEYGPRLAEINNNHDLEGEKRWLHKKLKQPIHAIYNYQKFYDYTSGSDYEILKPLNSRIIVLRGGVYNGMLLLEAFFFLFLFALREAIFRWLKQRTRVTHFGQRSLISLLVPLLLLGLTWSLCWLGAWGVAQAEEEYDKHVVGIFYGHRSSDAIKKPIEQIDKGDKAEKNGKETDGGKSKVGSSSKAPP